MNQIDPIIERYFDGDLAAAQMDQLVQWIGAEPAHAQRFMRHAAFHSSLRMRIQDSGFRVQEKSVRRWELGVRSWVAAAALVGLAVGTWLILRIASSTPQSELRTPQLRTVATLVSNGDAVGEFGPLVSGQELVPQMIHTTTGETNFLLSSLTSVTLTGPVQMRLDSPMHVTMRRGIATFRCPPGAIGFTVELPDGSSVVDLGTEFCVDANADGSTEVWVYVGSTRVTTWSNETRTLIAGDGVGVKEGRFIEPGLAESNEVRGREVVFSRQKIKPFVGGVHQDGQHGLPTVAQVFENGRTLRLSGNAWKTVDFEYTVTPRTVIEAEMRVPHTGEILGMGFDISRGGSYGVFQLFGSETIPSISRQYQMNQMTGWTRVTLPVGEHYTGKFQRLLFTCDDDIAGAGESWFRNVRVYERPQTAPLKETQE